MAVNMTLYGTRFRAAHDFWDEKPGEPFVTDNGSPPLWLAVCEERFRLARLVRDG